MKQHTPGPWEVGGRGFEDHIFAESDIPKDSDDWGEALICETAGNVENARLIAAAPETAAERDRLKAQNAELLEALEDVIRWNDISLLDHEWPAIVDGARKAILKAKGETL